MKIYARQIAPEYQESPIYFDLEAGALEGLEIYGNRDFRSYTSTLFDRLPEILEELAAVWDNMQTGEYNGAVWAAELRDVAPPEGRPEYTREERRDAWPALLRRWDGREDAQQLCDALELITGHTWDWCTLRGCCQRDWQRVIYRADAWDAGSLERLEAEYFNTGTEWIIHDGQDAPESPEDVSGYSVYCTGWSDDLIRQEIADAAGCAPSDVVLYEFDGWTRSASYKEV